MLTSNFLGLCPRLRSLGLGFPGRVMRLERPVDRKRSNTVWHHSPRNPMDAPGSLSSVAPYLPWGKTPLWYQFATSMSRVTVTLVSLARGSSIRCHFWLLWLKYSLAQVAQIFVSTWLKFSLTFTLSRLPCSKRFSSIHYRAIHLLLYICRFCI